MKKKNLLICEEIKTYPELYSERNGVSPLAVKTALRLIKFLDALNYTVSLAFPNCSAFWNIKGGIRLVLRNFDKKLNDTRVEFAVCAKSIKLTFWVYSSCNAKREMKFNYTASQMNLVYFLTHLKTT